MAGIATQLDEQLKAAYELIKIERFGTFSRKKAAEVVLGVLPDYIVDDVIPRNRGNIAQHGRLLARIHYLRATAMWLTGNKDKARQESEKIKGNYNCDEREMYDGLVEN